jgi:hypothetical protein
MIKMPEYITGSAREGGFGAHDHMNDLWTTIDIPVLLVTFKTAGMNEIYTYMFIYVNVYI